MIRVEMRLVGALAVLIVAGLAAAAWTPGEAWSPPLPGDAEVADGRSAIVARRLSENPIIRHTMDARLREEASRYGYVNVNGPSLIRVPPCLLHSAAGEQAIAIARLRRRAPAD